MATETEHPAACSEYEALLEDYIHGALRSGDAAAVKLHVGACANCRAAVEDALESVQLLHELSDGATWQMAPAPGFARMAMARIRLAAEAQSTERENFWQSFVFFGWRFAASAILALALLATYNARWGNNLQANIVTAPTTVRDIVATDTSTAPASRDDVLVMVAGISDADK